jgi:hypothetical protein
LNGKPLCIEYPVLYELCLNQDNYVNDVAKDKVVESGQCVGRGAEEVSRRHGQATSSSSVDCGGGGWCEDPKLAHWVCS